MLKFFQTQKPRRQKPRSKNQKLDLFTATYKDLIQLDASELAEATTFAKERVHRACYKFLHAYIHQNLLGVASLKFSWTINLHYVFYYHSARSVLEWEGIETDHFESIPLDLALLVFEDVRKDLQDKGYRVTACDKNQFAFEISWAGGLGGEPETVK